MPISSYLAGLRAMIGSIPILAPSVSVMIVDGQRTLIGRHNEFDTWVFPGGGVDPGERPADAAVREVWEETGLIVRPTRLLGVWAGRDGDRIVYRNGDVVDYFMTAFEAVVEGGELRRDAEEMAELEWVAIDEVLARSVAPWMEPQILAWHQAGTQFDDPTWTPPDSHADLSSWMSG